MIEKWLFEVIGIVLALVQVAIWFYGALFILFGSIYLVNFFERKLNDH